MTFRIHALPHEAFAPLFDLDDVALRRARARRVTVDSDPGYPCRVSLEDARVGETVILVNHTSMPAETPFRATFGIFVRKGAATAHPEPDEVPDAIARRLLSFRAFDAEGMLRDADVAEGTDAAAMIGTMLANPEIAEIHLHHARQGCYAARATRI